MSKLVLLPNPRSFTTSIHDYLTHKYHIYDVINNIKEPAFLVRDLLMKEKLRLFLLGFYSQSNRTAFIDASQIYSQKNIADKIVGKDYHLIFPTRSLTKKYESLLNFLHQLSNIKDDNIELLKYMHKYFWIKKNNLSSGIGIVFETKNISNKNDVMFDGKVVMEFFDMIKQGDFDKLIERDIERFNSKNKPSLLKSVHNASLLFHYIKSLDHKRIYRLNINEEHSRQLMTADIAKGLDNFAGLINLREKDTQYRFVHARALSKIRQQKIIKLSSSSIDKLKKISQADQDYVEYLSSKYSIRLLNSQTRSIR